MNNYIKLILTAIIGIIMLNSCSLEEIIPDSITPDKIQNENDVTTLIYGAYAPLNNPDGFKYELFKYLFVAGDDIYAHGVTELQNISAKTFGAGDTQSFWNTFYSVIGNANNLISVLDKMELSPSFEKRAYGEAYFLRGLSYYYLVRLYGGVPLRTEVTSINSNFRLPRSTAGEVYEQIFEDLKNAAESLPVRTKLNEAEVGRATKGAAQGLLAQAYITRANHVERDGNRAEAEVLYQNAVSFCDSVINSGEYKLLDDFGKLFGVDNESVAYDEVMFAVRFAADAARSGFGANGSEFAYRFHGSNSWHVTSDKPNGAGAAQIRPQLWVCNAAYSGDYAPFPVTAPRPVYGQTNYDYRSEITFYQRGTRDVYNSTTKQNMIPIYMYPVVPEVAKTVNGYTSATTGIIGKYIDASGYDSRNHGNDFFIMRFAEIPLLKAEALNELNGPSQSAVDLFNLIRARARKANGTARTYPTLLTLSAVNTKELFRKKILDERLQEFHAEGQRWFDLVRMTSHTDPTKTMYDYQWEVFLPTQMTGTPSLSASNVWTIRGIINVATSVSAMTTYHPKFKLFPVPTSELINNPNFGEQNPGWN